MCTCICVYIYIYIYIHIHIHTCTLVPTYGLIILFVSSRNLNSQTFGSRVSNPMSKYVVNP